jgi:flagellar motility protein MotE (MotC chaperone)
MRLRLLPSLIAITGLLLASKVGGLIGAVAPEGWSGRSLAIVAPTAQATETTHPEPATPAKPASPAPAAVKPAVASDPPADPLSTEERHLLEDLKKRRSELDARDHALSERESLLSAAEQRLVARAAELATLQSKLEQLDKERSEREEANWVGLVKVYETMKPQQAAAIFNDMDLAVLLQIADRMKESKAAVILGLMQPERARFLTAQLAAKRTKAVTLPSQGSPQ